MTAMIDMLVFVVTPVCCNISAHEHQLFGDAVLHAHASTSSTSLMLPVSAT